MSIAESHHQQLLASCEHQPFFPCALSGSLQSPAPRGAPSSGVTSCWETSLQRVPSQKWGEHNQTVPEIEAIGNLVSIPDLSREAIPTPHNTSFPLCFCFFFFFLLIIGPCEAHGYNQKKQSVSGRDIP